MSNLIYKDKVTASIEIIRLSLLKPIDKIDIKIIENELKKINNLPTVESESESETIGNSKNTKEAISKAFNYLDGLSKDDFLSLLEKHKDNDSWFPDDIYELIDTKEVKTCKICKKEVTMPFHTCNRNTLPDKIEIRKLTDEVELRICRGEISREMVFTKMLEIIDYIGE